MVPVQPFTPLQQVDADRANGKIEPKTIASMRMARLYGKYRLARGEFHRHSEISTDGGNDGTIIEQ